MDEFTKDFVGKFHSLPGDTVKEKQHHFYHLLNQNRPTLLQHPEKLEAIKTHLSPSSHLERIFRIDFLLYFKQFKELYQEYVKGDEITTSKLAKEEWFFQEAIRSVSLEEFVKEVLPSMPYAVKLKMLRRLPTGEAQSDAIFDSIVDQYGLFLATVVLCKCSVQKIEQVLRSQLIKLTPPQLKLLYNKDPNLISVYIEERSRHEGSTLFIDNNPVLAHIAQKNPQLFAQLFEKYKFKTSLGSRTTKRFISSQKSRVLDNSERYVGILKSGPLIRKLGTNLRGILFTKVPNSDELYWKKILQYYPRGRQFDIFQSVYNSTFHSKFGQDVDAINEDMLKLIKDPVQRQKIAKLKFDKEENDKYFEYFTPQQCLDEFKEKLSQMTMAERTNFVEYATKCCLLNRDLDALLKVCEMVAVRFKNDNSNIRYEFFYCLSTDLRVLDMFTDQHWKFILEILAKAHAENEYLSQRNILCSKYLEYLVRNNKSLKEMASKNYISIEAIQYTQLWKKPKVLSRILSELSEVEIEKAADSDYVEKSHLLLASVCQSFNKKYSKHAVRLSDNTRILESCKAALENDSSYSDMWSGLPYVVCQKSSSDLVQEVQKLYFEHFTKYGEMVVCLWLLKHNPKVFKDHMEEFLEQFLHHHEKDRATLWRLAKKYSHLDIDGSVVEHFSKKLQDPDFEPKKKLVKALTMLTPIDRHLDLVRSFVPSSATVDLTDSEVKDQYTLQCNFVQFLHYVKSPEAVLPVALQFCKGDYLKVALGPLYSSLHNLPETEVVQVLQKLDKEKALSVKKHALLLGCLLLNKRVALDYLKNATVPSLRPTLKYLARNPSDPVWALVKTNLSSLEKGDLQIIKWMENRTLPLEYRCQYVELTWALATKHGSKKMQDIVIKQMHKHVVEKLHPQFIHGIIEKSMFKTGDDLVSVLLIESTDGGKFDVLARILNDFKEKQWTQKQQSARKRLHAFVQSLFEAYAKSEKVDELFVDRFSAIFNDVFKPVEAFQEFVAVSLMGLKGQGVEDCGRFLVNFNNDLVQTYSRSVVISLAGTLQKNVMPYLFKTEIEKVQFAYFVFKHRKSNDDDLLVVELLPLTEPLYIESFKLYNEIVRYLEASADVAVRLQFNLYLSSVKKEEIGDWV